MYVNVLVDILQDISVENGNSVNEVEDLTSETNSEDSDSTGSLEDFIVPDKGFTKKTRKKLDKLLKY
jgi:hypothetical protein